MALGSSFDDAYDTNGTFLITPRREIWVTFSRPWWDVLAWLRWILAPGKRKKVRLRLADGRSVRTRALLIASHYIVVTHPQILKEDFTYELQ